MANASEDTGGVVICGGGVIGTAIAYYLAKKGVKSTVVDRSGIAAAASGRAGGFLALDWNDSSPLGALARLSFKLHAGLEDELGVPLDYRALDTYSVEAIEQGGLLHHGRGHKQLPAWVTGHIVGASRLGDQTTTAQTHPRKLTEAFMARATALAGSEFRQGTIDGIILSDAPPSATAGDASEAPAAARQVSGVRVDGEVVEAGSVVVAMGPWSSLAAAWLPLPMAVSGHKYHSAILESPPGSDITAAALFTSVRMAAGGGRRHEPEVYPRPDGTVYVCGEPQHPALPPSADDVHVHDETADAVIAHCAVAAPALAEAKVRRRSACFLPSTADGLPMLGAVAGVGGAYVATGHSCWGILNAPATGAAMAELIVDGRAACVDLAPFDPARFED